ncbi:MAG: LptF/LptG family permease [bacterium]
MSWILSKYIIREHIGPFFFGFLVIILIFILNLLFRELGRFLSKGLALSVILEFLFLNLAWMIALAVPMAVLTATLMAFGRLSADNEITAIKAGGISLYQILPPVIIVSTLLALALIWFNNHVLPDFNHRARLLAMDIARKKPMINLESGVVYSDIPNYNLLVQKIKEKGAKSYVEEIIIDDQTDPKAINTIMAKRGEIFLHQDTGLLEITLFDGEMQEVNIQEPGSFKRLKFPKHMIKIPMAEVILKRTQSEYRGDREKSAAVMLADIRTNRKRKVEVEQKLNKKIIKQLSKYVPLNLELYNLLVQSNDWKEIGDRFLQLQPLQNLSSKNSNLAFQRNLNRILLEHQQFLRTIRSDFNMINFYEKEINRYRVEVHKKYSIPAACIVFVLIGAPLGIMTRQGSLGAGAGISLGFFLLYWICLIGGELLADRRIISPFVAMWSPNILVGIGGILLVLYSIRETTFIRFNALLNFITKWRKNK